eukprot:5030504-Prymnesium_polylepis.1
MEDSVCDGVCRPALSVGRDHASVECRVVRQPRDCGDKRTDLSVFNRVGEDAVNASLTLIQL